jgi:hypothetical protein
MSEQHPHRDVADTSAVGKCSGQASGVGATMSCKEICAFLCDYVDGTLATPSRDAFDAHVAACSHCKEYLDTYAETIRLSKRCCCPKLQPPPPLPEDMVAAIVQAAAMTPRRGCGGRDETRDETGDRSDAGRA